MAMKIISTTAFTDQNPGTSGLRKKVKIFQQSHYVENFLQSIFDCAGDIAGKTFILGGDGRYFNKEVIQIALNMAAANGVGLVKVGKSGILSTPAASHLIRKYKAHGGIILSASHNPGGVDGDFGIKYNIENGGPAPEKLTQAIFDTSKNLTHFKIEDVENIDLEHLGRKKVGTMTVEVIDSVSDYADLMEELFDFDLIRKSVQNGFQFKFDAMHAVTGPYAMEIFVNRLKMSPDSVMNGIPLPDFGGRHPDPNPTHAHDLYDLMMSDNGPDLGAASDGDGDRNLIIGWKQFVTPSDSLAILAANAKYIKGYKTGIKGIARSMPTSAAADHVAQKMGLNIFETPTGWKFFGNLMDANKVTFCGEESFGTSSNHVREKDGLWAVLCWLNLMAATQKSVSEIVQDHWAEFGRSYYTRHDYEEVDGQAAKQVMDTLRDRLQTLQGTDVAGLTIEKADEFSYHDPIDGSISEHQGIRIFFVGGGRLVYRLSGTGTSGATLRLYMEHYVRDSLKIDDDTQEALAALIVAGDELVNLKKKLGRKKPNVII
ncbi:alpha-D-glucose phosphate-specific phosphoglucomutase [Bartonella tamiae]|uniref:phosphoglucomutase (alpha-D-glucose-1,6-bisphosphate-dependent) n=1 Tax=Bartonella tamiae Th239 TaxID=1094558 RepID=J0R3W1_9HYPH|nr:alpha-D-glucose phosphate-specific phosphoglucomutase [Bartonella tamiae]EJF90329.1 hypothetical protein ME5_00730 [Bartonella tamiae Th239]EJF93730.1 hypothetical protein MEG_01154 [Bartonella tamiae Th307]